MIDGMAWVLAPNIKALFGAFNKIAPNRDRTSDGTIGDLAHQGSASGHNPDESGNAERSDSDSVDEVRAGDVDTDLRTPGLTMEACVQRIVRTPNLRKRLIYVIYNGRIWSASSGWVERPYSGANRHDHHAHFSGHPDHDNNSAPWVELEQMEEPDMLADERAALMRVDKFLSALDGRNAPGQIYTRIALGEDHLLASQGKPYEPVHPSLRDLGAKLDALLTANAAEVQRDTALRLELSKVTRGEISADEFVDEIARRLAVPAPPATPEQ